MRPWPAPLIIRGGVVEDGDRIAHVGDVLGVPDAEVLDATGHTVTPGFVNLLGHGEHGRRNMALVA